MDYPVVCSECEELGVTHKKPKPKEEFVCLKCLIKMNEELFEKIANRYGITGYKSRSVK